LFVALGGVSWAAIRLPANSVGNAQLQALSVSNAKLRALSVGSRKIIPGAIGAQQVNSSQVQLRVTGPCPNGAMQSVAASGNVTCTPVLPNAYGSTAQAVTLGSGPTPVVSKSLPTGFSYLVMADANAHLTENMSGTQSVLVQCTLALAGASQGSGSQVSGSTTSDDVTVELDSSESGTASGTIPLSLPVVTSSGLSTVGVSCSALGSPASPGPTAAVSATINAIQTASNS
jgi:hypothetical protein